ncbi:LIM domain-binding protein 2 [Lamellibrachia satsuma]|nr:LIM domain-binding protein 2 [Lamellibrachia satsuma]
MRDPYYSNGNGGDCVVNMNVDPFYASPLSQFYRRQTPFMGQPDFRIYELNKRLQQRTEESDNLWWDAFTTEFFEEDAILTLAFCLEDGPKRYTIGRTLIPRYFRSIFEGGVTDLYIILKHAKESFHNTTITLDCDQAMLVTHHGKPMFTKVLSEGRLVLEFTFDDLMRIRSWHFTTRQHRELIPRSVIAMQQDPAMVEQLSKNITRQGLTNYTLNFLRLCVILEPMQELMSRHKAYGLTPRDCLKTTLFQKWQRMVAPPGELSVNSTKDRVNGDHRRLKKTTRQPNKRRKRKSASSTNSSVNNLNANNTPPGGKQKRSPGPQGFNPVPGDVMVVGEPTLMGGEFGDEDERLITRLENTQIETNGGGATSGECGDNAPIDQKNILPTSATVTAANQNAGLNSKVGGPGSQPPPNQQFQNSPSVHSPWGADKKTPQPTPSPTEIKTE